MLSKGESGDRVLPVNHGRGVSTPKEARGQTIDANQQLVAPPSTKKKRKAVSEDHSAAVNPGIIVLTPNGGGDQTQGVNQKNYVPVPTPSEQEGGHKADVTQPGGASPLPNREGDLANDVSHYPVVSLSPIIQAIVELWRRRQAWHRAEKSLTLQAKALLRRLCGGDKTEAGVLYTAIAKKKMHPLAEVGMLATLPLLAARDDIEVSRIEVEKQLKQQATPLPGIEFVRGTPGLSEFTLYSIVGECPGQNYHGLLDFPTVAKLWKRMGVAVMPDGQRQRRVMGSDGIKHGFDPSRRALLWTIGDSLIKAKGPYRDLYLQYKEQEKTKAKEKGLTVAPAAKIPKKEAGVYISEGVVHLRAKRHMEKTLLKNLWCEWRKASLSLQPSFMVPVPFQNGEGPPSAC